MKKIILSLLIFTLYIPTSFAALNKIDDLTILVSSCDKYSSLWNPFFVSLFKHWPTLETTNKHIPIFLVANSLQFNRSRVSMLNIPNEISWSDNMLYALDKVSTKYVMIVLDDYWLNQNINEERLLELFNAMRSEKAAMIQVSYNDLKFQSGATHPKINNVALRDKFAHYKISLQVAIWDKDALLTLLRPGEDPWTFELAESIRAHGYPGAFLTVSSNEPISYINASHLGHITPAALDYCQRNQIPFEDANLKKLGGLNWQINYKIWKNRARKLLHFVKNPGLFYEFRQT